MPPSPRVLRTDQGTSSSAYSTTTSRRRIDDSESNWMDAESTTDEESTDDESAHAPTSTPQQHLPSWNPSRALAPARDKPLIAYVTNSWAQKRTEKELDEEKRSHPYYDQNRSHYYPSSRRRSPSPTFCDEALESRSWRQLVQIASSRLTFKLLFGWAMAAFLIYSMKWWFGSAAQKYAHAGALYNSAHLKMSGGTPRGPKGKARTWFGTQFTSEFEGLQQIGHIRDEEWTWDNRRRMIIIGDVHGCEQPLQSLLDHVKFEQGRDTLVFTGDLVAKGPDTGKVLDIAIKHNASCVRGNHDDRLLLLHRDLQSPLQAVHSASGKPVTGHDIYTKERDLAGSLSKDQISYLQTCPLILDLGELAGLAAHAYVAHAGLVPGLEPSRQDPYAVMNMRSIDLRTHVPIKQHAPSRQRELKDKLQDSYTQLPPPWDGKKNKHRIFDADEKYVMPWNMLWEEWQRGIPKEERALLVYGHDGASGLVEGTWAVGLDSGCVYGGRLSALVLEMKDRKVKRSIRSVKCGKMR